MTATLTANISGVKQTIRTPLETTKCRVDVSQFHEVSFTNAEK